MKDHPEPSELRTLVDRTVEPPHHEQAILDHVSGCDSCFEIYERHWAEASADLAALAQLFPDAAASERLQALLFRRMRLASLGSAGAWLVTEGFLRAILGVVLPIVEFEAAPSRRARGDRS